MIAADLAARFATLPVAWREALPDWDAVKSGRIAEAVGRVSGDRPIGPEDPFRALRLVAPSQAKVVVFGQDPYPGPGQADGLAFSAPRSSRPSLRRIFDVLEADRPGWRRPLSGRLDVWARQGVLLLNPSLSVEIGRANSHTACGWQAFTSEIVKVLQMQQQRPVFLLWGDQAASFFESAVTGSGLATALRTRHPSNDFRREFMAEGSHFVATASHIDWWALSD